MKKNLLSLVLLILVTLPFVRLNAQAIPAETYLYAIYPYDDSVWAIDTSDFSVKHRTQITSTQGLTFTGGNGLAYDPDSCLFYGVVKVSGLTGRLLVTMDPKTGVCDTIGNTGDNFAGLAMDDDGRLFGVTGDGGNVSETLYEINRMTAATTLVATLGAGSDGECIGYCSDNDKVYHWSGRDTNGAMESIDSSGTVTTITRTGYNYDEVFGAAYIGNGEFLLANLDQEWITVDTSGFAVLDTVNSTHEYYKGMAFYTPAVTSFTFDDSICKGDTTFFDVSDANSDSVVFDFGDGSPMVTVFGNTSHLYATPGTYVITQYVFAECNSDSLMDTLFVGNIPTVGLTPSTNAYFCAGDSVMLSGSSGGSSQWYMNGSPIAGATSNTYMVSVAGVYNMVKTNQNGCGDSAFVGVTVGPVAPLTITPSDSIFFCPGDTAFLNATPGYANYQWYAGGNPVGPNNAMLGVFGPNMFTVSASLGACVDSVTQPVVSVQLMNVSASFTQSLDTVLLGNGVNFTNTSTGGGTINWTFGDGNTSTMGNPSNTYGLAGTYTVTLTTVGPCDSSVATSTVVVEDTLASIFSGMGIAGFDLIGNYPNPFSNETTIEYKTPYTGNVSLIIYDLVGREVAVLVNGQVETGTHKVIWNGKNQAGHQLQAGNYIYKIEFDGARISGRMQIIK